MRPMGMKHGLPSMPAMPEVPKMPKMAKMMGSDTVQQPRTPTLKQPKIKRLARGKP